MYVREWISFLRVGSAVHPEQYRVVYRREGELVFR